MKVHIRNDFFAIREISEMYTSIFAPNAPRTRHIAYVKALVVAVVCAEDRFALDKAIDYSFTYTSSWQVNKPYQYSGALVVQESRGLPPKADLLAFRS